MYGVWMAKAEVARRIAEVKKFDNIDGGRTVVSKPLQWPFAERFVDVRPQSFPEVPTAPTLSATAIVARLRSLFPTQAWEKRKIAALKKKQQDRLRAEASKKREEQKLAYEKKFQEIFGEYSWQRAKRLRAVAHAQYLRRQQAREERMAALQKKSACVQKKKFSPHKSPTLNATSSSKQTRLRRRMSEEKKQNIQKKRMEMRLRSKAALNMPDAAPLPPSNMGYGIFRRDADDLCVICWEPLSFSCDHGRLCWKHFAQHECTRPLIPQQNDGRICGGADEEKPPQRKPSKQKQIEPLAKPKPPKQVIDPDEDDDEEQWASTLQRSATHALAPSGRFGMIPEECIFEPNQKHTVKWKDIDISGGGNIRGTHPAGVEKLAESIKNTKWKVDTSIVCQIISTDPLRYKVIDGMHRYMAIGQLINQRHPNFTINYEIPATILKENAPRTLTDVIATNCNQQTIITVPMTWVDDIVTCIRVSHRLCADLHHMIEKMTAEKFATLAKLRFGVTYSRWESLAKVWGVSLYVPTQQDITLLLQPGTHYLDPTARNSGLFEMLLFEELDDKTRASVPREFLKSINQVDSNERMSSRMRDDNVFNVTSMYSSGAFVRGAGQRSKSSSQQITHPHIHLIEVLIKTRALIAYWVHFGRSLKTSDIDLPRNNMKHISSGSCQTPLGAELVTVYTKLRNIVEPSGTVGEGYMYQLFSQSTTNPRRIVENLHSAQLALTDEKSLEKKQDKPSFALPIEDFMYYYHQHEDNIYVPKAQGNDQINLWLRKLMKYASMLQLHQLYDIYNAHPDNRYTASSPSTQDTEEMEVYRGWLQDTFQMCNGKKDETPWKEEDMSENDFGKLATRCGFVSRRL